MKIREIVAWIMAGALLVALVTTSRYELHVQEHRAWRIDRWTGQVHYATPTKYPHWRMVGKAWSDMGSAELIATVTAERDTSKPPALDPSKPFEIEQPATNPPPFDPNKFLQETAPATKP